MKQNSHIHQIQDMLLLDGTTPNGEQLELALEFVLNGVYHKNQDECRNKIKSIFQYIQSYFLHLKKCFTITIRESKIACENW